MKASLLPGKAPAGFAFHTANKNMVGDWLVSRLLAQRGLSNAFGGVYLRLDLPTARLRGQPPYPVIFCATHSGWWDGHVAALLNRKVFKHNAYLMMEEANLVRYPFFTWSGVFGVDRDNPRKALAAIDYISKLLIEQEGSALWMFPQGTITYPDARPLKIYGGVANIVRKVGRCALVPVALRYDFLMEQAPDVFACAGPPLLLDPEAEPLSSREITARLDAAMTRAADRLHSDVIARDLRPYRRVLSGRGSVNRIWDSLLKACDKARGLVNG